MAEMTSSFRIM